MKKHYFLGVFIALIFAGCKKDVVTQQVRGIKEDNSRLSVIDVGGGGGTGVIYDGSSGKYKTTYQGADLEFSPIPTDNNFREGDVVNTNIICTNCLTLVQSSNGYFTATMSSFPNSTGQQTVHEKIEGYNKEWSDYIDLKRNPDSSLKQPTMPSFPNMGDANGIITVSGVVVRSAANGSTVAVMPSTFMVNPPANQITATLNLGGVSGTYGGNNYYYDISIDPTSKVITNVTAFQMPGYIPVAGIVWHGSAKITGSGINQLYYVTFTVIKEGSIMIEKTNHLITE